MAGRKRVLPILLLSLVVALTACLADVDQTITLLADERWESTATLEFPAEADALLGGQLDNQLAAWQQALAAGGGRMVWERRDEADGRFVYNIEAAGQGFEMLGDFGFMAMDVQPQEIDGQRRLVFFATPAQDASRQTLTLIGGGILSSNGEQIGRDTVRWINPTQVMEATLTERGGEINRSALGFALIGAGVLMLLALLAWVLVRRRAAPPPILVSAGQSLAPPTYRPPADSAATDPPALAAIAPQVARTCASCGTALRPTVRFCAACGQAQPD